MDRIPTKGQSMRFDRHNRCGRLWEDGVLELKLSSKTKIRQWCDNNEGRRNGLPSVIFSFIGKLRTRRVRSQSRGVEMYLTPATLYALRLSLHQGAVSSALRRNIVERNVTKSAFVLATVGLSMSMFSVKKMLASKHRDRL